VRAPAGTVMHCCGGALTRRDWMWGTVLSSVGAMFAGCAGTRAQAPAAAEDALAAATALLRDNISIDVHTHAGANGITSRTARPSDELARQMRTGRIAILCLADVPDGPILGRNAQNVLVALRTPEPGFLYAYHLDRLAWVDELVASPLPSDADGLSGPIGLGFRVPLLVVSPWSRGGFVCHDTFDHTSLLRFLETRFGAEVPNLSAWRRSVTGDLTSALNLAKHNLSVPPLPQPSVTDSRITTSSCAVGAPVDLLDPSGNDYGSVESTLVPPYPVTVNSSAPPQEPGTAPAPSGCT